MQSIHTKMLDKQVCFSMHSHSSHFTWNLQYQISSYMSFVVVVYSIAMLNLVLCTCCYALHLRKWQSITDATPNIVWLPMHNCFYLRWLQTGCPVLNRTFSFNSILLHLNHWYKTHGFGVWVYVCFRYCRGFVKYHLNLLAPFIVYILAIRAHFLD
jgi:hypothetical protein